MPQYSLPRLLGSCVLPPNSTMPVPRRPVPVNESTLACCAFRFCSACTFSCSDATPALASPIVRRLSLSVRVNIASAWASWARAAWSCACEFATSLAVDPFVDRCVYSVALTCDRRLAIVAAAARSSASSSEGSSSAIRSPCLTGVPSSTSSFEILPWICGLTTI